MRIPILILILVTAFPTWAEPALLDLKKAAEAGDPIAQKQLAQRYEHSFKYSEAEFWYRKIALTGDPDVLQALDEFTAIRNCACMAVPAHASTTNGLALITLAAVQGHKSAQRDLAYAFHTGKRSAQPNSGISTVSARWIVG